MSELSIKVSIGGRTYPLTIKRSEEEKIRKAASEIDKNLKELKNNYAVVDTQDLLAMTVLQYATESVNANSSVEFDRLNDEILALRDEIIK
jgi:cell division protein ZapA|tara:strand:+ start:739 stop:1011 length:273 start_codon:yes stop_codon:yes gene_type:complete